MKISGLRAGKGEGGGTPWTSTEFELSSNSPARSESEQFGGLVFWVGDKAIGGKMFAWIRLEDQTDNQTRASSPTPPAPSVSTNSSKPKASSPPLMLPASSGYPSSDGTSSAPPSGSPSSAPPTLSPSINCRQRFAPSWPCHPRNKNGSSPSAKNFSPPNLPPNPQIRSQENEPHDLTDC